MTRCSAEPILQLMKPYLLIEWSMLTPLVVMQWAVWLLLMRQSWVLHMARSRDWVLSENVLDSHNWIYSFGEQWNTMNLQLLRGMPVYLAKAAQGWLCTGSFLLSSNLLASLWNSLTIKLLLWKIPPNIHMHKFLMTWDCYNCNL